MIDHFGVNVSTPSVSRRFYEAALAPLGLAVMMEVTAAESGGFYEGVGFGENGKPVFWTGGGSTKPLSGPCHIAFAAQDRAAVDAFYAAAMAAGGRDNGKPGLRPEYHANYYAAFVIDPDGHNVEAVCHKPV